MARTNKAQVNEVTETIEPIEPIVETPAEPKKIRKAEIQPTPEQIKAMESMNTSNKIRYLAKEGYSTSENLYSGIGNYLGVRTQHVRNVLNQVLKGKASKQSAAEQTEA